MCCLFMSSEIRGAISGPWGTPRGLVYRTITFCDHALQALQGPPPPFDLTNFWCNDSLVTGVGNHYERCTVYDVSSVYGGRLVPSSFMLLRFHPISIFFLIPILLVCQFSYFYFITIFILTIQSVLVSCSFFCPPFLLFVSVCCQYLQFFHFLPLPVVILTLHILASLPSESTILSVVILNFLIRLNGSLTMLSLAGDCVLFIQ